MCKTKEGKKEVQRRIRAAKENQLKRTSDKREKAAIEAELKKEIIITKENLSLISQISMNNNESEKRKNEEGKMERVHYSSPFEYGLQCIYQCRHDGEKDDEDAPQIYKKKTEENDDESTSAESDEE